MIQEGSFEGSFEGAFEGSFEESVRRICSKDHSKHSLDTKQQKILYHEFYYITSNPIFPPKYSHPLALPPP